MFGWLDNWRNHTFFVVSVNFSHLFLAQSTDFQYRPSQGFGLAFFRHFKTSFHVSGKIAHPTMFRYQSSYPNSPPQGKGNMFRIYQRLFSLAPTKRSLTWLNSLIKVFDHLVPPFLYLLCWGLNRVESGWKPNIRRLLVIGRDNSCVTRGTLLMASQKQSHEKLLKKLRRHHRTNKDHNEWFKPKKQNGSGTIKWTAFTSTDQQAKLISPCRWVTGFHNGWWRVLNRKLQSYSSKESYFKMNMSLEGVNQKTVLSSNWMPSS